MNESAVRVKMVLYNYPFGATLQQVSASVEGLFLTDAETERALVQLITLGQAREAGGLYFPVTPSVSSQNANEARAGVRDLLQRARDGFGKLGRK